ncbi:hypothetical protein QP164_14675 [Sphingomonas sp. LR59]|uniref:hypothetical protein n=1 Tax=Sphingomonas sp. LR59 TaxID=3050232 RepID=UPI002FE0AC9C
MTVLIETVERTYFPQRHTPTEGSTDEAVVDILGRVESASKPYDRYAGQSIEIALRSSRSFSAGTEEETVGALGPFSISLRKRGCSVLAYLPSDAFWAIPGMISDHSVTHIGLTFDTPRHGSGSLESIHFAPALRVNVS